MNTIPHKIAPCLLPIDRSGISGQSGQVRFWLITIICNVKVSLMAATACYMLFISHHWSNHLTPPSLVICGIGPKSKLTMWYLPVATFYHHLSCSMFDLIMWCFLAATTCYLTTDLTVWYLPVATVCHLLQRSYCWSDEGKHFAVASFFFLPLLLV